MLDFRQWGSDENNKKDMIEPNETLATLIRDNYIGGVILFANNLKDKTQIEQLTTWYASIETNNHVKLFIGIDNEGGNVFRLPREEYPSFPGNMALAAAIEGGADKQLAMKQGEQMANDLRSLSFLAGRRC